MAQEASDLLVLKATNTSMTALELHDLILRDSTSRLIIIHGVDWSLRGVHILDKGDAKGTTAILVASELGYTLVVSK